MFDKVPVENKKCERCCYLVISALFLVLFTYIYPEFDTKTTRIISGVITVVGATTGVLVGLYLTAKLVRGHTALNRRLQEVYFMAAFVFACTAAFGLAGILHADSVVWHKIYDLRAAAIVLEVFALIYFMVAWIRVGKD